MRLHLYVLVCASLLTACTSSNDSNDDASVANAGSGDGDAVGDGDAAGEGDAGAGGMSATGDGDGDVGDGDGDVGDGDGDVGDGDVGDGDGDSSLSCVEREVISIGEITAALQDADLRCNTYGDCVMISDSTDCHAGCGVLTNVESVAGVESVIATLNATTCAGFEASGCDRFIPPCEPPQDFTCSEGRCLVHNGGPECADQEMTWGGVGGLVAWEQSFTLKPCNMLTVERRAAGGSSLMARCETEIATGSELTAADVDTAMMHADVQTAIADAPVLYGSDPRILDGQVLRVTLNNITFEIGGACQDTNACPNPIPEGVEALRGVLVALAEQQLALPECEALQP